MRIVKHKGDESSVRGVKRDNNDDTVAIFGIVKDLIAAGLVKTYPIKSHDKWMVLERTGAWVEFDSREAVIKYLEVLV